MTKWVLLRAIDKFEREWKYDAGYLRDIVDASPRAAWLFSRCRPRAVSARRPD
jgi:hypothetical protein